MFLKIRRYYLFYKMYEKGIHRENLGEYPKALHNLFYALSLKGTSLKTYLAIARVYRKHRQYLNALDFYSKAIAIWPEKSEIFALKADLHRRNKEFDLAIKHYDEAIRLDFSNIEYYIRRAQIKFYLDDIQGAINDYNAAIAQNNKDSKLFAQRGFYKLIKKQYESAKEDFTTANQLSPNNKHIKEMLKIVNS